MATKEDVELWVLEYACRYQYADAIQGICKRRNGDVLEFDMPPIRLAEGTLCLIVEQEDFDNFDVAIQLVEEIYNSSGELVPFKLFAKLSSGLKIKALLHMLANRKYNILEKVNEYFPRSGLHHNNASKKTLAQLNANQFQFRKFFLPLLANENQRLAYLQKEYLETFGNTFVMRLKGLVEEFIGAVEKNLPPTFLEKLMTASKNGQDLERKLREEAVQCPHLEIVLDTVLGQTMLTSESLQELLTMVSPLNTQDRLVTSHPDLFTDHTDSFSEDSGTDQTPPMQREEPLQKRAQNPTHLPNKRGRCSDRNTSGCVVSERQPLKRGRYCDSETRGCMNSELATHPSCSYLERCRVRLCDEGASESAAQDEPELAVGSSVGHRSRNCNRNICASPGKFCQESQKGIRLLGNHAQLGADKRSVVKGAKTWCGVSLSPVRGLVADEILSVERRGDNCGTPSMNRCSVSHMTKQTVSDNKQSQGKIPGPSGSRGSISPCREACVRDASPRKPSREPQKLLHNDSLPDNNILDLSDSWLDCEGHVLPPCANRSFYLSKSGSISDIDRSSDEDGNEDVISGSEDNESPMGINDSPGKTGKQESSILRRLISPYRKSSALKLCVVKLFKNKGKCVFDKDTGTRVDLYS